MGIETISFLAYEDLDLDGLIHSTGRVLAYHTEGPEFKPLYCIKQVGWYTRIFLTLLR